MNALHQMFTDQRNRQDGLADQIQGGCDSMKQQLEDMHEQRTGTNKRMQRLGET